MPWTIEPPRVFDGYVDIEMWRHNDHVVVISWEGGKPTDKWAVVRTSKNGGDFNDGRYLPPHLANKLFALVKDAKEKCTS